MKCETLHGVIIEFARSDADDTFNGRDENLAVANPAGLGGALDCVERLVDLGIRNCNLDYGLGQELHGILGTAIEFRMAFLPAVTLDIADGHTLDAKLG
jgi:hypothetical protein